MNGINRYMVRFSFVLILLLALAPACKDDFNSSIPYVKVYLDVNLVNFNHLKIDGNSAFFYGGYGGIIITNSGFGYYACDAACPYEVDVQCKVELDGGPIATCPCCGSTYNLLGGGIVISGPSSEPLKPYGITTYNSGNSLLVTN